MPCSENPAVVAPASSAGQEVSASDDETKRMPARLIARIRSLSFSVVAKLIFYSPFVLVFRARAARNSETASYKGNR